MLNRIAFSAATKRYPVSCQHLSDMWRSTLEIGAAQLRFVTEITPQSPFLCVNRSGEALFGMFRVGSKAIQSSVNIASTSKRGLMPNHWYEYANKTHFHHKGFALGLVLKVTVFGTRKWLIHINCIYIVLVQVHLQSQGCHYDFKLPGKYNK